MRLAPGTTGSYDVPTVRSAFPVFRAHPQLHFLDNAATTQCPGFVQEAVNRHETEGRANVGRGVYALAERATAALEDARATVAHYLGAGAPSEVVFTSGATAALNLTALALADSMDAGDEIVLSVAEHHSNLVPWQLLARRRALRLQFLPATADGRIDTGELDRVVTERCRLITLTHASNVTGAVTDVAPVVAAARAVGARVVLDGAQLAPQGPLELPALGVDIYAFSGHKVYGPGAVGVWWVRQEVGVELAPAFGGGGMVSAVARDASVPSAPPSKFEAGTPPIAQAIGLARALKWLEVQYQQGLAQHLGRLTGRLLAGLAAIPGVRLVGPAGTEQRIGVVSFTIDGVHPHDVCQVLDGHGVAARGGLLCAQPLMEALGVAGCTRVSLAAYNHETDVDALLSGVEDAMRRLR